jgi:hypothetical protein
MPWNAVIWYAARELAGYSAPRVQYFLFDGSRVDTAIARERPGPRRNRVQPTALTSQHITKVILHHGVAR